MRYIAAIDYEHLDNSMFLSALARSLSQQGDVQPIIVHGESDYTERIMQTGVMREQAKIRSIKGLNHRLINLFADEGVSAVGINGHRRELITIENDKLSIDSNFFEKLPRGPVLLISTLVQDLNSDSPQPIALPRMTTFLKEQFEVRSIYTFNKADKDEILIQEKPDELEWTNLPPGFAETNLPDEFRNFNQPLRLTTARDFARLPDNENTIFIH